MIGRVRKAHSLIDRALNKKDFPTVRKVFFLMTNEKGRCDISDNAPKVDQTPEADPININFVGLEPQLRDDVHLA